MSFTPNNLLKADPLILLRDRQHAARLFTDDQFRLLPKTKFMFHVSFSLNPKAVKDHELITVHNNEINMLVKSVDLPHYSVSTDVLNQYNRKKVVQYHHKMNEVAIIFHDDNANLINKLWQNYYKYYYGDPISAESNRAYTRNAMQNVSYLHGTYGFDNGSTVPFFNYITVYQMTRKDYVSYKFINPLITGWNHSKLNYNENSANDFIMKLQYESVAYGTGVISDTQGPEGFGLEHYDHSPSPLSADASSLTASAEMTNNVIANAKTLLSQLTTYNNSNPTTVAQTTVLDLANLIQTVSSNVSGLSDVSFAVNNNSNTTIATQSKIGL